MSLTGRVVTLCLVAIIGLFVTLAAVSQTSGPALADFDWRSDWSVERGFEIVIDAQGFQLPTSISFVPDPGPQPKDPLYFVTELQGTIKVVTNDRSVFTFAENVLALGPDEELPFLFGLAGMCLDPKHGYVFATFTKEDPNHNLRNHLVRFKSRPQTFSLTPSSSVDFSQVLAPYESSQEHQIGPCLVRDDLLYVSVGDGSQTGQSQRLDSLLGKVIRMTLDGQPALANPFYQDDAIGTAANYVWAYGLRNPFGLTTVGDDVFVADNGPAVDRFLRISEGENYLWDGTDLSIGTNADAVLFPGKGVAQMDHLARNSSLFPERFRDSFFLVVTGSPGQKLEGIPAIMVLPYDIRQGKLRSPPRPLMRYRGGGTQVVAGLAFGPDGLYFAPMLPNEDGMTAVLRVEYSPEAEYPFLLDTESNPVVLMNTRGCFACHTLNNQGGTSASVLDRELLVPRVQSRLESQEYARAIEELDLLDEEPFSKFREARRAIREAEGLDKVTLWLENRIQEPKFDDPDARMPNLGLSAEQARIIAAFLAGVEEESQPVVPNRGFFRRMLDEVRSWFPAATRGNAERYAAAVFGIGLAMGGIGAFSIHWVYVKFRKRRGNRLM